MIQSPYSYGYTETRFSKLTLQKKNEIREDLRF